MLEDRNKSTKRDQFVVIREKAGEHAHDEVPHVGPWMPQPDGSLFRVVIFAGEPDPETEQRVLATP